MAKIERVRDLMRSAPSADYFRDKANEGWRLLAVEWERGTTPAGEPGQEIPFGLRVAADCRKLEENPDEIKVLMLLMEVIVQDGPLSKAAEAINKAGYRTRDGEKWTPSALFVLLPRLIEAGPQLFKSDEWAERRRHLLQSL